MSAAKLLRNGAGRALTTGDDDLGNAALSGADALEALAVVAPLLALCACADMVTAWDANGDDIETRLSDQQRAALATLAKIASEGK